MVITKFFKTINNDTLDILLAVGSGTPSLDHNKVELFTLSTLKWQLKTSYPYQKVTYSFSILAIEKKFILFGGLGEYITAHKRKAFTNQDTKRCEQT